jgi:DNA-binding transcriptional ArsR family regulator
MRLIEIMNTTEKKLYEIKAEIIQAMGHPLRLAIIDFLSRGEQCVCDISKHIESERSNVSRHLSVLLNAGILECRKEGLNVFYSLKTPCILNFFSCVADVLREKMKSTQQILQQL